MVTIPVERPSKKDLKKQKIQNIAMLREENEILKLLVDNYKLGKEWEVIQKEIEKEKAKTQKKREEKAKEIIEKAKIEEREVRVAPSPNESEPPTPEPKEKK